jgi:hypothetical protein
VPADARLWERLAAPLRHLRWAASAWSTHADRSFHDAQFTALDRDPFSRAQAPGGGECSASSNSSLGFQCHWPF